MLVPLGSCTRTTAHVRQRAAKLILRSTWIYLMARNCHRLICLASGAYRTRVFLRLQVPRLVITATGRSRPRLKDNQSLQSSTVTRRLSPKLHLYLHQVRRVCTMCLQLHARKDKRDLVCSHSKLAEQMPTVRCPRASPPPLLMVSTYKERTGLSADARVVTCDPLACPGQPV